MGYSWGIHGIYVCIGYVSVMYRLCIGYVSVMCRNILGALGKGENRKKRGTTTETTLCHGKRGTICTTKIADYQSILSKIIETIYSQDLLERRMERMKQMSRRQFVNSGGFVHYQNCRLLEYIIQKLLGTIYNQDLLERRMERMKQMIRRQHRQQFRGTNIVPRQEGNIFSRIYAGDALA